MRLFGSLHERGTDSDVIDRIASRPVANRHLKFSHAGRAQEAPQPTKMSNIAQSLPRNGAPIDEQQEAKTSRVIIHVIFAVRRLQRPLCKRAFLISLGLVAIAVPSIANESATGMADPCP